MNRRLQAHTVTTIPFNRDIDFAALLAKFFAHAVHPLRGASQHFNTAMARCGVTKYFLVFFGIFPNLDRL
jgi:hypothetical protein